MTEQEIIDAICQYVRHSADKAELIALYTLLVESILSTEVNWETR